MFTSCLQKQQSLKEKFSLCRTQEEIYQKLIELGKSLEKLEVKDKTEDNLVLGCQSLMYLLTSYHEGTLIFKADSEALISKGLAAALIEIYSGETAETLLKCPPTVIQELKLLQILTPGRANGFQSLYLKMKQEALRFFHATH
jgi:cysteine desulfuration protein SufE